MTVEQSMVFGDSDPSRPQQPAEVPLPADTFDLRLLAESMKMLQTEKETLEERLKQVNADLDKLRLHQIPERMAELGVPNIKFTGLGRLQLASDLYASTKEGKKDAAMEWLRDLGYENMITEGYNTSSLKALFRQMIAEGKPIPDDIFNVTPFTRASLVKG